MNDPESAISKEDRQKQRETTKVLYDMTQKLAYTVYELDEIVKATNSIKEKEKSFAKDGDKIKTAFETLKDKLVVTKGDNYVGSAEPQLREKLADLYVPVTSNFTAPTNAQMENLEALKSRMNDSMKEFETLKTKYLNTVKAKAEKAQVPFVINSFEEFVK